MATVQSIHEAVGGKFFHVAFIKRTNGEKRLMRCRMGVRKYVTGAGAKYSFEQKNLLSVWDLAARGYRTVPVDAIIDFRCGTLVWDPGANEIIRDTHQVMKPDSRRRDS